ncbi:MAG TPA: PepSY domain-containing protein [Mariprofundaceae bacterium]|nr:PepSY domain-containing protein [Mariprofundaceae bacterium]
MNKYLILLILFGLVALPVSAYAFKGQALSNDAKISIEQARTTALKSCPGKISDEELEKEKGGSGLRYSFDMKNGKDVQEIGIDAVTGKVLESRKEGAHPD